MSDQSKVHGKVTDDGKLQYINNANEVVLELDGDARAVNIPVGASFGNAKKVVGGVHLQASAADTIITGLTTVESVVVSFQDAPTANQIFVTGTIGDQAGAPAAGSVIIKTWKTTSGPVAATTFSDNLHVNWVATGS